MSLSSFIKGRFDFNEGYCLAILRMYEEIPVEAGGYFFRGEGC